MSLRAEYAKAINAAMAGGNIRDMTPYASPYVSAFGEPFGAPAIPGLPRPPGMFTQGSFTPSLPPPSQYVDAPGPGGAVLPRRWQYPVGYNLPTAPGATKLIDFNTLENLADIDPITGSCIRVRANEIAQLDWEIVPRDPASGDKYADRIKEVTPFFQVPDPIRGLEMDTFLKMLVREVLVKDALSLYPHETWGTGQGIGGSNLKAIEILDGSTIKPLMDLRGARPEAPAPAYQQYLYGVPRSEMVATDAIDDDPGLTGKYSAQQLYYRVYNPRPKSMYGFSNVEQIILNINLALKKLQFDTNYFTDGTVPAGLFHLHEDVYTTPAQVREFEEVWNQVLAGDPTWKWKIRAVPGSTAFTELRKPVFDSALDEWRVRITCMGMDVTPEEIGLAPKSGLGGTGWGEQQENILYRKSLRPMTSWISLFFNEILATWLKSPFLKFKFLAFEVDDQIKKAQADQILVNVGIKTPVEGRVERGLAPYPNGLGAQPLLITRQGPILLEDVNAASKSTVGKNEDGSPRPAPVKPEAGAVSPSAPAPTHTPDVKPMADPSLQESGDSGSDKAAQAAPTPAQGDSHTPGRVVLDLDPAQISRAITELAKAPTILLLRHGETPANKGGLIRGWTDPALDEDGRKAAEILGEALKGAPIAALYSSDLQRASETADIIGKAVGVKNATDRAFRPWNLGNWQGKPAEDTLDQVLDMERTDRDRAAPGGESFNDFLERYIPRLREAQEQAEKNPDKFVVVVTHLRNLRAADAWMTAGSTGLKLDIETLLDEDEIGPGGFEVLAAEMEDEGWRTMDRFEQEGQTAEQKTETEEKAADLRRWRDKALKALKAGRSPGVKFTSTAIDPEVGRLIAERLNTATTSADVRWAFGGTHVGADDK